jgi:hypothetical protein
VLGKLSEQDQTSFEEHYYVCGPCLEEVRLLQSVQGAASQTRPAAPKPVPGKWAWAAMAAAIIAALGLTAVPILRHQTAQHPATAKVTPAPVDAIGTPAALQLLARAEPPRYVPSKLRGAARSAEDRFRAAMQNYARGDYAATAEGLRPLVKASPDAVAPLFYLGVCDLVTGHPGMAAAELRRAEAVGNTPFLEPSRFFLAKALIAQEDVGGAGRALDLTIQLKGDRETEARQLLDQLRALPPR